MLSLIRSSRPDPLLQRRPEAGHLESDPASFPPSTTSVVDKPRVGWTDVGRVKGGFAGDGDVTSGVPDADGGLEAGC